MRLLLGVLTVLVACGAPAKPAAPPPPPAPEIDVRFLERDGKDAPWRAVAAARADELRPLLDNEPARLALALFALAWELAPPPETAELGGPVLFIGVEKGGNHVAVGLNLEGKAYPELPYLRLAADAETFRGTLLHETGHAIHAILARGGNSPELAGVAPIVHSTAAVTDRRTAFNEGFAIHLETIHGACAVDATSRAFYDHAALRHGPTGDRSSEYYFPAKDVMTYSQTFARYGAVRDGLYAFETAARGDYLRVQLDPARDLRTLRDASSMLASEGFVASVIFHVVARDGCPDGGLVALVPRYRAVLAALRTIETTAGDLDTMPLVELVAAIGEPAIDAFLDLSRGVTVDAEAAGLWARLYDAALTVDLQTRDALFADLEARRTRWRTEAIADPRVLARRVGPVVAVQAKGTAVGIAMFGPPLPMSFDANAAGAPLLSLVPGWTEAHVSAYLAERERAPFASLDDLRARLGTQVPVAALEPLPM